MDRRYCLGSRVGTSPLNACRLSVLTTYGSALISTLREYTAVARVVRGGHDRRYNWVVLPVFPPFFFYFLFQDTYMGEGPEEARKCTGLRRPASRILGEPKPWFLDVLSSTAIQLVAFYCIYTDISPCSPCCCGVLPNQLPPLCLGRVSHHQLTLVGNGFFFSFSCLFCFWANFSYAVMSPLLSEAVIFVVSIVTGFTQYLSTLSLCPPG